MANFDEIDLFTDAALASDPRINEARHGPAGARRFDYSPNYIFRVLKELHLEFTPKA